MSNFLKYALYGIITLVLIAVVVIMYRLFFQFNEKEIKIYVAEEAARYKDSKTVEALIHEAVLHVLSSHTLSQQVLITARKTGTDKEQVLVHTAIEQCKALGYFKK